jgi:hypothetical protein
MTDGETKRVRRILHAGDPHEPDFLHAHAEVEEIRSALGDLRARLREVARVETDAWFDSVANDVAGSLSTAIMALYSLVEGDRSLKRSAENSRLLWKDVAARPEFYIVKPGTSRKNGWRPSDSVADGESETG